MAAHVAGRDSEKAGRDGYFLRSPDGARGEGGRRGRRVSRRNDQLRRPSRVENAARHRKAGAADGRVGLCGDAARRVSEPSALRAHASPRARGCVHSAAVYRRGSAENAAGGDSGGGGEGAGLRRMAVAGEGARAFSRAEPRQRRDARSVHVPALRHVRRHARAFERRDVRRLRHARRNRRIRLLPRHAEHLHAAHGQMGGHGAGQAAAGAGRGRFRAVRAGDAEAPAREGARL